MNDNQRGLLWLVGIAFGAAIAGSVLIGLLLQFFLGVAWWITPAAAIVGILYVMFG